jgi:hypothetical protein
VDIVESGSQVRGELTSISGVAGGSLRDRD